MTDFQVFIKFLECANKLIHENIAATIVIIVIIFIFRKSFVRYFPQIFLILIGKRKWADLMISRPEKNFGFCQKEVWVAPETIVVPDCDTFQAWMNGIIDYSRRENRPLTINFAYVRIINAQAVAGFKHVFESAIKNNNIVMTIIFPKPDKCNEMTELMHWGHGRIEEESSKSIKIKKDTFLTNNDYMINGKKA